MPRTEETLREEAETVVQAMLTRYLEVNLHDHGGGDPEVGWQMEQAFQAQRATVIDLVVAGLRADDPPFL